ncbi:MAG: CDP-diacylglycerol--glycerol-3-phosphate 3-phosphatidyltransferase [Omnitrophica bacterium RIFCSPLOWO2_12_FULL_44_17]|uniref:CDP-diacylglycerol--glycerol-3-phosphate 3-phosphatidyltransferase n=1 Tax=Candidatus Danuiimicrobium aquiferis TaxID=1801832 RepID=A0A1G1KZ97_9BACT|nr:MAG: CDP-diacylglycerol--glycerol-3-phosphate 3-phosphatidyltransferase [Omnitrophica bacterium RIFCSPHIGHO2_02_FULL_45_28]OGW90234.1 MAG: CDP-diacylglycerol--glycerol-3-phosphate 3-phosphatidyltransferase [Omnitrophica bacterium RIFCSPHIGHO2_12_FULL_44_12]OGW97979.1 MAG: CDP-diacylglycerol--glycerol-3-phosphate 3-phosphatidyltransferase [Omnitrophica bacterium RIFCSPLOWO2_12_FULL_44_17]OGX03577.1 MAG: CDP-diacylglycerol--glycerol-3-phosphate 3-phosphatidyltransferase [Omnitrophica bacterium 
MNIPNFITLIRILLVPGIVTCIAYANNTQQNLKLCAFLLFIVAIITDGLDGYIARRFNLKTQLGTFLDPFADKLLLVSCFVAISLSSAYLIKPPAWIIIIIVFRELVLVCGLLILFFTTNKMTIRPNYFGKITTVLQMIAVIMLLGQWHITEYLWYILAIVTSASGLIYVFRDLKQMNSNGKHLA